jgi:hypothetical protein
MQIAAALHDENESPEPMPGLSLSSKEATLFVADMSGAPA